ncbi:hypothetical protein FS827_22325 [Agrobacterium vitis]|uniref:hypothetical protein n=1 Tax=Allorhizobium ampelinum TaxID=3025782 RepID=UPI001F3D46EC|nr:hypothetical protein [Allorhizobium ampelinum]MCF1464044.1 hypothetical protein [Allorhizobium ampelinum]
MDFDPGTVLVVGAGFSANAGLPLASQFTKSLLKKVSLKPDSISLYSSEKSVTFVVSGKRFRKDGTLGKVSEAMSFTLDRGVRDGN